MRRTALLACALLLAGSAALAATPDELWQDYQKNPDIVSTTPTKPPEHSTPTIIVETLDGTKTEPTTPDEAKSKAVAAAETEETQTDNAQEQAAEPEETQVDNAQEQAAEPAKEISLSNAAAQAAPSQKQGSAPVVSNKPVSDPAKPKPKPKLNLVGKPPLPRQFMRTPQAADFEQTASAAGGYSISLPRAFGTNPLAELPDTDGAMLVRTADDTLMCAVTMLDENDAASFNATQPLPKYENSKLYWIWQHDATLAWKCRLSSHNDYHGDKMLLEAEAKQGGKTYQLLFVMPAKRYTDLLPQAMYALNSFKLN